MSKTIAYYYCLCAVVAVPNVAPIMCAQMSYHESMSQPEQKTESADTLYAIDLHERWYESMRVMGHNGKKIMNNIKEMCRQDRKKIFLSVARDNEIAKNFYEKIGFKCIGHNVWDKSCPSFYRFCFDKN